jgi:hypothetical protein
MSRNWSAYLLRRNDDVMDEPHIENELSEGAICLGSWLHVWVTVP